MRTTPKNITDLQPNEVFVFGSNESGRHGAGAARTAMKWGAQYGQAEGLQGRTYGLPTVNASISNKIRIEKIKVYVNTFLKCAKSHPELTFLVTEVGCGLAGHTIKAIAPLFKEAATIENIHLPKKFWRLIK
jgi:hypothetical protein